MIVSKEKVRLTNSKHASDHIMKVLGKMDRWIDIERKFIGNAWSGGNDLCAMRTGNHRAATRCGQVKGVESASFDHHFIRGHLAVFDIQMNVVVHGMVRGD